MFILSLAFLTKPVNALEQPEFKLVEEIGKLQIRKYQSHIVARTLVNGAFDDAGNMGFKRLAGYIFGGNKQDQKIAMTAPVGLKRYAGLSPETQYWVTFSMPRKHTMQTLPAPNDSRVKILAMPERYLAVLKYKGNWSEQRYQLHETLLLSLVEQETSWLSQGDPSWSRYNPPFVPWFLRTNEVAIEVIPVN